jgi:hypothetical protein
MGNTISPLVAIPIASDASLPAKRSSVQDPSFTKVSRYFQDDKNLPQIHWTLNPASPGSG